MERVDRRQKEAAMEVLHKSGILFALFDADDTKYPTHELFLKNINLFNEAVTNSLNTEEVKRFTSQFHELNKAALSIEGISVSEEKWDWILGLMARIYPNLEGQMNEHKHFLEEIYTAPLGKIDDVEDSLVWLESGKIELGVLTHASEDWNKLKLESSGLAKFFHPKHIHTVSVYGFKGRLDWSNAVELSGFTPTQTIAFGNSLTSDILPAHEAGIEMKVWLRDESARDYFAQGSVPDGTIVINHYRQLYEEILKMA